MKQWRAKWADLVAMFELPAPIRKAMDTTNAIESVNSVICKFTRNRKHDPNAEIALKLVYLAIHEASKKWAMPIVGWKAALNHLAIAFEGRIPQNAMSLPQTPFPPALTQKDSQATAAGSHADDEERRPAAQPDVRVSRGGEGNPTPHSPISYRAAGLVPSRPATSCSLSLSRVSTHSGGVTAASDSNVDVPDWNAVGRCRASDRSRV